MRFLFLIIFLCTSQPIFAEVIGKDNRVKVTKHSKETWGTGVVYAEYPGHGFYKCSGTLISHYHVLTSAHCIHQPQYGGYPKQVTFVPRVLKTETGTNDRFFAEHAWINKNYLALKNNNPDALYPRVDIAIIKLTKNHKDQIPGKLHGFKGYKKPVYLNKNTSVVAYKNQGKDLHTLYKHDNCTAFLSTDNTYLSTECDTSEGSSGSALLNKEKKVIGVLTGTMHSKTNVFTALSKHYLKSISAVRSGKQPTKDFIKKQFDTSMYFAVHLKNSCHKKIYVAYTYKSLNGDWITDGFAVLEPYEVGHNKFVTQNTVIGFYAQTYNGDLKWSGDDYKLKVQGKEYPFYRKQLPQRFTDQTFSWSCNS